MHKYILALFLPSGLVQSTPHRFPSLLLYSFEQLGTVCKVKKQKTNNFKCVYTSGLSMGAHMYWTLYCPSAEGMKAGNYGNLLVQIEQPRGEYAVTIAFLSLLKTLVKVSFYP